MEANPNIQLKRLVHHHGIVGLVIDMTEMEGTNGGSYPAYMTDGKKLVYVSQDIGSIAYTILSIEAEGVFKTEVLAAMNVYVFGYVDHERTEYEEDDIMRWDSVPGISKLGSDAVFKLVDEVEDTIVPTGALYISSKDLQNVTKPTTNVETVNYEPDDYPVFVCDYRSPPSGFGQIVYKPDSLLIEDSPDYNYDMTNVTAKGCGSGYGNYRDEIVLADDTVCGIKIGILCELLITMGVVNVRDSELKYDFPELCDAKGVFPIDNWIWVVKHTNV